MAAADLAGETIDFDGLPIEYDDTVLTPRPWTAAQSHWARELLATAPDGPVLELCAGAGHIGLLAVHGTGRALVQVDASVHACAWAVRNARRCGVPAEVRHGRMGDMLAPQERFAVIIADPPWVPSDGVDRFPADPRTAIDGGPDGLDLARECVTIIGRHLQARGAAVLQVADREQAARLPPTAADSGLTTIEIRDHDRGALVLLRRTGGQTMAGGRSVDPKHDRTDEPGGDEQESGSPTVPGIEGPEGVPDLPVPDDPGTGGPDDD